jgi:ElaB/YqjD/DUF883 family membrane-anchored ribosome-binding protein
MEVYFGNLSTDRAHLDKLASKMEALVENAEELVQSSAAGLPEPERQRLTELLAQLRSSAGQMKLQAVKGFQATDRIIRRHPYQSAGIALVAGLLIGVLAARPSRNGDPGE